MTPPRVPELRSVQQYVGSEQPVLMDWAVGLAFPCQQPMLHANGVTEIPKFRITPDYSAKKLDTDTWQDGLNGGLLGITDLLLRAHVMSTYLSHDWGRDWGSLRKFDTIVDAAARGDRPRAPPPTAGCASPGKIRIKPWTALSWAEATCTRVVETRVRHADVAVRRRRRPRRGRERGPAGADVLRPGDRTVAVVDADAGSSRSTA